MDSTEEARAVYRLPPNLYDQLRQRQEQSKAISDHLNTLRVCNQVLDFINAKPTDDPQWHVGHWGAGWVGSNVNSILTPTDIKQLVTAKAEEKRDAAINALALLVDVAVFSPDSLTRTAACAKCRTDTEHRKVVGTVDWWECSKCRNHTEL